MNKYISWGHKGYLQQCTFYNQHQNQSGTVHPLNNLFQGAQEAWATYVQRDHPASSHRSWGSNKNNKDINVICNARSGADHIWKEKEQINLHNSCAKSKHTGCICWAPACCNVTSDSGEKLLGQVVPWCYPCWSHQHNDSLGHHAPYPTWRAKAQKSIYCDHGKR